VSDHPDHPLSNMPAMASIASSLTVGIRTFVWGPSGSSRECRCCRVILSRHQIAFAAWRAPLLGCAKRSSPKAACGAPKVRGLTANAPVRAITIVAATYKGHSALFEALWIATVGASLFTNISSLAA
jgi:hypothetical protein